MVVPADLALSRRLERAEGRACVEYATARGRLFPNSGTEWIEEAGAYAVFDGAESPITQSFGLGVFEELTAESLEKIERFFFERGASADHELSPLAGASALDLMCARGYRPIEISSVMYQSTERAGAEYGANISVRSIGDGESKLWAEINAKGWAHDHPELLDFLRQHGSISAAAVQNACFLAEIDGEPGAAAALSLHEGVALFAGAATVPELRRRGLQTALLQARMRFAFEHGCDLAMMVAAAGSGSQRNAERQGFRVAYTRMKWRLRCPEPLG